MKSRNRYEIENFLLAIGLILIVLFANSIAEFIADVILSPLFHSTVIDKTGD